MLLRSLTLGFQEPQAHLILECVHCSETPAGESIRGVKYVPDAHCHYGMIDPQYVACKARHLLNATEPCTPAVVQDSVLE